MSAVFSVSSDGTRWIARGDLTFANAGPALAASKVLPLPSTGAVDCAGITAADSAAVAVLLAIKRRAVNANAPLAFVSAPPVITTLAALYGVESVLAA